MKLLQYAALLLLTALLSACIAPIQAPSAETTTETAVEHIDEHAAMPEHLGTVNFPVTCTSEAQAEFNHGMALLHSFMFAPAGKSFNAVATLDPACAMAYWGIAMNQMGNPFTWPLAGQALVDGWAAVEQARAVGAQTPREQGYIDAVAALYENADSVDHRTRALAYEQAMAALAEAYPDDSEAKIYHALSLLATALPTDKTYANQLKAIEILESLLTTMPDHPGITHYLIHSNDYPALAAKGLDAARRYADIAPDASHAVHMPSHIFTRMGYWQDSIEMNRRSAAAAEEELSATYVQGAGSYNAMHAMDYLMYAYLQLGEDAEAQALLDKIYAIEHLDVANFSAAFAFAAMPARFALERGQWADAAALELHPKDLAWEKFPQAEAVLVFARGLGAARAGDAAAARAEIERLQQLSATMTEMNLAYWVTQTDIQIKEIDAWATLAEGRNDEALAMMREAAALEDQTEKHPVTPGPLIPAHELLGEMLIILDAPAEALQEFEVSQKLEPNRFRGYSGAGQAAELAGDAENATANYTELLSMAQNATGDRAEITAARAYLGQ